MGRGAGGTSKAVRAKVLVCRLWSWASETLVGQKSRPCGEKDAELGTCHAAPLRRIGHPLVCSVAEYGKHLELARHPAQRLRRGAQARVTIGRARHSPLQTFRKHRASSNVFSNKMSKYTGYGCSECQGCRASIMRYLRLGRRRARRCAATRAHGLPLPRGAGVEAAPALGASTVLGTSGPGRRCCWLSLAVIP